VRLDRLGPSELPVKVGQFTLQQILGHGGVGIAFRAESRGVGGLPRVVCLLASPPAGAGDPWGGALDGLNEARLLRHRGIVQTFSVADRAGAPFVVTELVEGLGLDKLVAAAGALPARSVLDLGVQACAALASAHGLIQGGQARPVLHGALRASRVMIGLDGVVKVRGFGLRGLEGRTDGRSPAAAAFLAPEQLRGRRPTSRSDLFAVGVCLALAATGDLPGPGPEATGAQRLAAADQGLLTPELAAAVAERCPGLQDVLARLLEVDPDRRYAQAREAEGALRELRAGVQGGARLSRLVQRHLGERIGTITQPGPRPTGPMPVVPRAGAAEPALHRPAPTDAPTVSGPAETGVPASDDVPTSPGGAAAGGGAARLGPTDEEATRAHPGPRATEEATLAQTGPRPTAPPRATEEATVPHPGPPRAAAAALGPADDGPPTVEEATVAHPGPLSSQELIARPEVMAVASLDPLARSAPATERSPRDVPRSAPKSTPRSTPKAAPRPAPAPAPGAPARPSSANLLPPGVSAASLLADGQLSEAAELRPAPRAAPRSAPRPAPRPAPGSPPRPPVPAAVPRAAASPAVSPAPVDPPRPGPAARPRPVTPALDDVPTDGGSPAPIAASRQPPRPAAPSGVSSVRAVPPGQAPGSARPAQARRARKKVPPKGSGASRQFLIRALGALAVGGGLVFIALATIAGGKKPEGIEEVALPPADEERAARQAGRAASDGGASDASASDGAAAVDAEADPFLDVAAGPEEADGADDPPVAAVPADAPQPPDGIEAADAGEPFPPPRATATPEPKPQYLPPPKSQREVVIERSTGPVSLSVSHRPARSGRPGASDLVSVKVTGAADGSVTLHYGRQGGPYQSKPLKNKGRGRFEGWLPFEVAAGENLAYWIQAAHPRAGSDAWSGSRSNPHLVPVK